MAGVISQRCSRRAGRALRARLRQVPRRREPARRLPLRDGALRRRPHRQARRRSPPPRSAPRSIPSPTTASWTCAARADRRCSSACSASRHAPPRRLRRRAVRDRRVPRRPRHAWSPTPRSHAATPSTAAAAHSPTRTPSASRACSPPPTASSLLEALDGTPPRPRRPSASRLHALGAALARACTPRRRVDRAARSRGSTRRGSTTAARGDRPRAAGRRSRAAQRLLARLLERGDDARRRARAAPRRREPAQRAPARRRRRVALLDLEHLSIGPAAADLGQVLAALIVARTPQARERAAARLRRPARQGRAALAHGGVAPRPRRAARRSAATARDRSPGCASCSTPAPTCVTPRVAA